ncbi:exopolysaccharide biosynthesis polyprenyl glycosylphosphotransferase [Streptomyces sp. 549]|uniref:exopolysaccharide biosynthesis polyprenyl glycosylphosphotransferase n=1 Tax=Streptomyces sp. 549 TaxID=3049076 RepID=UPI0024C2ADB5|nr:exopolysaccharide biosynthesis polyprenyl glycosylphosphotransferase [Streptomyces sp. 549]MDK1473574.1 exopolysaccharide biosynthesis polyprenyl glycosylphosphotransferase [Streptomyces sp. 549]
MTTESADAHNSGRLMSRPGTSEQPAPSVFPPPRSAGRTAAQPGRLTPRRRPGAAAIVSADSLAAIAAGAAAAAPATAGQAVLVCAPALALAVWLNARGGLYRPVLSPSAFAELPALFGRVLIAWCVAAAVLAATRPGDALGWAALATAVTAHVLLAAAGRSAVHLAARAAGRRHPRSTLVVGPPGARGGVTTTLYEHPEYGMRPVGLVTCGGEDETGTAEPPLPVLSSAEDITRAVIQNSVTDAVFAHTPHEEARAAMLVRLLTERGCTVWLVGADPGTLPPRTTDAGQLWGHSCRRVEAPRRPGVGGAAKRALDLTASAAALVLLSPLLLLCAATVRLADGPGVIFRQERIGRDGLPFTLLKFRTLRPADAFESATLWSVAQDNRMSPVGRLLRRSSLDELPQLWNVLRGDMSMVGPRPERPYFVRKFSQTHAGYAARHRMPVGITGLAQVNGLRGDTSIEERARFDNHYIDTWSLWQDVRIMLRTATSLFRLGGS